MLPFNTLQTDYGLFLFRLDSYPLEYCRFMRQHYIDQEDIQKEVRSIYNTTQFTAYTVNTELIAEDTPFVIYSKKYMGLSVEIQLNTLDDDGRCLYTCTGYDHNIKRYEITAGARDRLRKELNMPLIKKAREILEESQEIRKQQYLTGLVKQAQEEIEKNNKFIQLVEGVINE